MSASSEGEFDLSPDFPELELKEKFNEVNQKESKKHKIKKFRFALSPSQRVDLLNSAAGSSMKHALMIETQLMTGLRVGEIVNLRIDDVNFGEKNIYVIEHLEDEYVGEWTPKTLAGNRFIPIYEPMVSRLRGYIRDDKRQRGYFFTSQKSCLYREESVINFINKYAIQTKSIGHSIGSHSLRRTFASHLINDKTPIGTISKLLGHKSIEITMKYLFLIDDMDIRGQIEESMKSMIDRSKLSFK